MRMCICIYFCLPFKFNVNILHLFCSPSLKIKYVHKKVEAQKCLILLNFRKYFYAYYCLD